MRKVGERHAEVDGAFLAASLAPSMARTDLRAREVLEARQTPQVGVNAYEYRHGMYNDEVAIFRQMSELRAQHRQLSRLLTPSERSGLGIEKLLQAFDDTRGSCSFDSEIFYNSFLMIY